MKSLTIVSDPTFYGSRVGLLVGIIRQAGGGSGGHLDLDLKVTDLPVFVPTFLEIEI